MPWELPVGALFVIERLEQNGYRADIVGGCVRDLLCGAKPHDFDITTDATPEQMLAVFSDVRTIATGLRHGTLTVMYEREPYEVTTYRTEDSYTDHRHPDGVTFTRRLSDDLCRRDFTVNAMCYHPTRGVTDLYGGVADLRARVIRCVGDPACRLTEDALRILRALRFSAVLDFSIDSQTSFVIHEKRHLLSAVSAERIYTELVKLLDGVRAGAVFDEFRDVFDEILPSLVGVRVDTSVWQRLPSVPLRLLSLFADAEDAPARFADACIRLRTDRALRLLGEHLLPEVKNPTGNRRNLLTLLYKFGQEEAEQLLTLRFAVGTDTTDRTAELHELLQQSPVYRLRDLALRGADLLALGLRGEAVGCALDALLLAVMDGRVDNERDALLTYFKQREITYGI